MNFKNRMIMNEYSEQKGEFEKLGGIVHSILKNEIKKIGLEVLAVEYRVKENDSLAGKLELKGDKYASLDDITDILGARVITLFEDDVDTIANIVTSVFKIDYDNSIDKRKCLDVSTFGYLSVHYICSLKEEDGYPKELCKKRFELQIRSTLQHIWAVVNHDMGYKSEFGVPNKFVRELSRVAGLLELADEQFVVVRDGVRAYENEIREKIASNNAGDVVLDIVSLREYVKSNPAIRNFIKRVADICHAEITSIDPEPYLAAFHILGKKTIGDLQAMLEESEDLAIRLAEAAFANVDLDILSSNVGFRFLCRAEMLLKGYSEEKVAECLEIVLENEQRAKRQAKHLFDIYAKIKEK